MATIGEELKAARERKGLTIGEVAEKTRISHSFLKALEDEDYSVIPGEVFVTGFLRTYAKELGLDQKELVARYKENRLPPVEPQSEKPAEKVQHEPKPSIMKIGRGERPARRMPLYVIILAGLLLGALLTGVTLLLTPKQEPAQAPPMPAPEAVTPPPAPFAPATTSFGQATAFKPMTAARAAKPGEKKGPLVLKLTADEKSWYSYKSDGVERKSGQLAKGASLQVVADREILLDIGNAGGVTVEFDGKTLKPYGPHGSPGIVQPPKPGQVSNVMRGNQPIPSRP